MAQCRRYGHGSVVLLIVQMNTADAISSQGFGRRPEYTMCKVNLAGSTFADQVAPASFSKRDQDESMGGNDPWKIESMCHRLLILDQTNHIPSFPGIELLDEEDGGPLWDDVDWEDMKFEHAADSN